MKIPCAQCGQRLEIDDEYAGHTVCCPICEQEFRLPAILQPMAKPANRYGRWIIGGLAVALAIVSALITLAAVRHKKPLLGPLVAGQIQPELLSSNKPQTPMANSAAHADIDPKLAFRAADAGGLSFGTGIVKGSLTKDGLSEGLKTVTLVDGKPIPQMTKPLPD
jgi:hypothetical protein